MEEENKQQKKRKTTDNQKKKQKATQNQVFEPKSQYAQQLYQKLTQDDLIQQTVQGESIENNQIFQSTKNIKIEPNQSKQKQIDPQKLEDAIKNQELLQENLKTNQSEIQQKSRVKLENIGQYDNKHQSKNIKNVSIVPLGDQQNQAQVIEEILSEPEEFNVKPENMLEPTQLPFVKQKNQGLTFDQALNSEEYSLVQFPARFAYQIPDYAKAKDRIKRPDKDRLNDNKELLQFKMQRKYDSAGNIINKFYQNIDHLDKSVNQNENKGLFMGKMRIYKDGRVKFVCGENQFQVVNGVNSNTLQQISIIDAKSELNNGGGSSIYQLGNIKEKYVIKPDIEALYIDN